MAQADPAWLRDRPLPIVEAGDRRANRTRKPQGNGRVCSSAKLLASGRCLKGVECESRYPPAKGIISEDWMERMPQPRAIEEVLDRRLGRASRLEHPCDSVLELFRYQVEPCLLFDHLDDRSQHHVILQSALLPLRRIRTKEDILTDGAPVIYSSGLLESAC
jgi:hypothetical protein